MKKAFCCALCAMLTLSFTACSATAAITTVSPTKLPPTAAFDDYDARREILDNNPIDQSFYDCLNSFAYSTAEKLLTSAAQNSLYSPVSLYMALAVAATGAEGQTLKEMLDLLGPEDVDTLTTQLGNYYRAGCSDNEIGKLLIANSIWLDSAYPFKSQFAQNAADKLYATVVGADLADPAVAQAMEKWVSDNTKGLIQPDIQLDPQTVMAILNTVYFKDEWIDRFYEEGNTTAPFYLADGSQVETQYMNRTYDMHSYKKGEGYTLARLSLKNSGSMVFVLPDKGTEVTQLMTAQKLGEIFSVENGDYGKVIFQIPKFDFGAQLDLKQALEALGMTKAFTSGAEFGKISDATAFISSVRQQTHIAIDEKGVEAAAYTEMMYAGSAQPDDSKLAELILDRPFLFAIEQRDGVPLFIGLCANPEA